MGPSAGVVPISFFVPSLQGEGFYLGWGRGEAPLTSEALNQPEGHLNSRNATLKPFNLLFVHRDTETQSVYLF